MAKRRAAPKRRAKKVISFHQAAGRKRSEPKADLLRKAVYSQEALEPGNLKVPLEKASEPTGNAAREDVWNLSTKMAKQFAEGAQDNARTFGIFMPPLATPSLMRNGMQAITRELLEFWAEQIHLNLQSVSALPTSRTPQDLLIVQSHLAKATLESMFQVTSRISSITIQIASEAGRLGIRGGSHS